MAHPHRIFFPLAPYVFEQRRVLRDRNFSAAEFTVMPAFDLAAELRRHRLLAVADPEQRHAGIVDRLWRERRILVEHGGRAAGEDDRLWLHIAERSFRSLVRHDLGIDLFLTDPARN